MKFDLEKYAQELNELVAKKEISKDTARSYISCLNVIDKNCGNFELDKLKNFLVSTVEDKKQFLKYVAAIRKYEKHVLRQDKGILFGEPEIELFKVFKSRNSEKGKEPKISESSALRKVNALRNEKLKYALRLQLKSGLRVSEVAELRKDDIKFSDGKIKIYVRHGKGDKAREVNVIEDTYLYERLPKYISECKDNKLFYTTDSLRLRAAKYDIQTHDLRRINARKRLKIEMKKGKTRSTAKKVVQKELGHESSRTTDLYIGERRK